MLCVPRALRAADPGATPASECPRGCRIPVAGDAVPSERRHGRVALRPTQADAESARRSGAVPARAGRAAAAAPPGSTNNFPRSKVCNIAIDN